MAETLRLSSADRVLVFAPHPDDESIACGGLLLAARDANAARRVVTVTDGDNNPWPQRWIEKRWRIDAAARADWGARRRAEANAALDVLGVPADERFFLGLPDGGLTDLLARDAQSLIAMLHDQIAKFSPTLIAMPALVDRHPDHSALYVALSFALNHYAGVAPRLLAFSVHGKSVRNASVNLPLDSTQQETKRRAILEHVTQMRLSGKRFLAFVQPMENYQLLASHPVARTDHPLRCYLDDAGCLTMYFESQQLRGHVIDPALLILTEGAEGVVGQTCFAQWSAPTIQPNGDLAVVAQLDLRSAAGQGHLGFVKILQRQGLSVYDSAGWQAIEYRAPN